MANNGLTGIELFINNEKVGYLGEIEHNDGFGEAKQEAINLGGGVTETVYTEDITTKFSMVKVTLKNTKENQDLKRALKLNKNNNVIELVDTVEGFSRFFTRMAILNDPTSTTGVDGTCP